MSRVTNCGGVIYIAVCIVVCMWLLVMRCVLCQDICHLMCCIVMSCHVMSLLSCLFCPVPGCVFCPKVYHTHCLDAQAPTTSTSTTQPLHSISTSTAQPLHSTAQPSHSTTNWVCPWHSCCRCHQTACHVLTEDDTAGGGETVLLQCCTCPLAYCLDCFTLEQESDTMSDTQTKVKTETQTQTQTENKDEAEERRSSSSSTLTLSSTSSRMEGVRRVGSSQVRQVLQRDPLLALPHSNSHHMGEQGLRGHAVRSVAWLCNGCGMGVFSHDEHPPFTYVVLSLSL